jgi:hypothetical protein
MEIVFVELSDKAGEVTMFESTTLRKGAAHNTHLVRNCHVSFVLFTYLGNTTFENSFVSSITKVVP